MPGRRAARLSLTYLESFQIPGCLWMVIVRQRRDLGSPALAYKSREDPLVSYFRVKNEPDWVKGTFLRVPKWDLCRFFYLIC